jgi:glutathione S-transferase
VRPGCEAIAAAAMAAGFGSGKVLHPGEGFSTANSASPRAVAQCSWRWRRNAINSGAMRLLYHFWLSPPSRKLRLVLQEKGLEFTLKIEKWWERRPEFLALNPAGEVPVLIEPDGTVLADAGAIAEFLDETYRDKLLIGINPIDRAEARRLVAWFDVKMNREVTDGLLGEKVMKRLTGVGQPDSTAIRVAKANLAMHLDYISYLAERRRWLAGDHFSVADISAAAHLSALDYLGDVPWDEHEPAKEWYARIKSRPSFRPLLADHIPGTPPPKHYADLDF